MKIKLVIFDFDGVFTDGKCYFDANKNIIKYYNIKDGMGISLLKKNNIKVGLISSYNSSRNVSYVNEINKGIVNHLNFDLIDCFDYKYIGKNNKLEVLNNWMKELNIEYNNIAYIGDDINDVQILERVGFAACPNDAILECKKIVKYVCQKDGGNGCVREFVDCILEDEAIGLRNLNRNILSQISDEMLHQINNFNLEEIDQIVEIIRKSKTVYFTGIGKSETMANHCANLLKSISINVFYLNAINALHGDIGTIGKNDVILLFSKSGNTSELLQLIPFIKSRSCYTIGVCCDENSKFLELCDMVIRLPFGGEIDSREDAVGGTIEDTVEDSVEGTVEGTVKGGKQYTGYIGYINKIPTNSCMTQLLFSNILVSLLKKDININEYKENHPAGNIGNNLKKIKDCIKIEYPKLVLRDEVKLHDILLEMTKFKIGCCFFVNEIDELIGILTDGDIRRLLLKDENKKIINIDDINKSYYYEENLEKFIYDCKKMVYIPVLNKKIIIGII